jgi:PhnB protein
MSSSKTLFAPQLLSKNVLSGIEFYKKAFGAVELRRVTNPDGSVHIAEMSIDGAIFQIHEELPNKNQMSPQSIKRVTCLIGLFVEDPDAMVNQAAAEGGRITSPLQDFEYGYRQGVVTDPFEHQWLIQKKIEYKP